MLPDNWRDLSYRQLNLDDHTLDKNLPVYATPLQRKPPERNAGVLETLSLELLHLILAQLDIRSVMNVRYVNSRCAELVDSLPELRTIARNGQNALRGSLAINTAPNISVERLHQQLSRGHARTAETLPHTFTSSHAREFAFSACRTLISIVPLGLISSSASTVSATIPSNHCLK